MAFRGITGLLPIGSQGFTGTQNPSQAGPGHFLYVDGAELEGGIIRKEGGAEKLNEDALGDPSIIVSGFTWSPDGATYQIVVFLDKGTVLGDDGSGAFSTSMATGLNDARNPAPVFAVAGGETVGEPSKLFMFSSSNQAQVVEGPTPTTFAAISDPAADWSSAFPIFGVSHAFRLFAGGNASDPHRLYYSTTGNHEDFVNSGSGSLAIYPGEGQRLVGAISFRGALVLFKYPTGIYVLNTSDPTPANWALARLTKSVGTLSQHTIVQIENDTLYMDQSANIHQLSATNEFGDVNTSNISEQQQLGAWLRKNLELSDLVKACGIWYPTKRQAWFAVPRLSADENDLRMIIGYGPPNEQGQAGFRFFLSRRDVPVSMWTAPDANNIIRPLAGDDAGFVWRLDIEARNKDGAGYPILFETANLDMAFLDQQLATRQKNGAFLELSYEPRGSWNLDVEVHWDDKLTQVITFPMGFGGALLDSFVLDTDVLAADAVRSTRSRVVGSGRRLKLIASNDGMDEDVSLSEFHLAFTIGDERIQE